MRANLGCGDEGWGEIRVDLRRVSKANILADIENLPFRDQVFEDVRCISVIEHVTGWYKALREILRVSRNRVILEVPVNSDIRKTDVFRLLFPTPKNIRMFFSIPERAKQCKWQFKTHILYRAILNHGFFAHWEKVLQMYCGMPSRCWRFTARRIQEAD